MVVARIVFACSRFPLGRKEIPLLLYSLTRRDRPCCYAIARLIRSKLLIRDVRSPLSLVHKTPLAPLLSPFVLLGCLVAWLLGQVYDEFVDKVTQQAKKLRQGPVLGEDTVDVGAMVMPAQLEIVQVNAGFMLIGVYLTRWTRIFVVNVLSRIWSCCFVSRTVPQNGASEEIREDAAIIRFSTLSPLFYHHVASFLRALDWLFFGILVWWRSVRDLFVICSRTVRDLFVVCSRFVPVHSVPLYRAAPL